MKKFLTLALVLALLCSVMAGCVSTPAENPTDPTEKPTEAPTTPSKANVSYAPGEGATGEVPNSKSVKIGEEVMLPDCSLTKEGYLFGGWSDGTNVYQTADFYVVEKDVVFTAVWNEIPTKLDLGDMENLDTGWEGFPPAVVKTENAAQGNAYIEVTAPDVIVFRNMQILYNLTPYMETGILHISIYITDPAAITGGQIELTSSGTSDQAELSVGQFGTDIALQAGWNHLEFNLSDFKTVGGDPVLEKMNYIRVYFLANTNTSVGIDDMYIYLP